MKNPIFFIGDGPLFNHCIEKAKNILGTFFVITKIENEKNLSINKKYLKKFSDLNKIKQIDTIFSIMNGKILSKKILDKTQLAINFHDAPLPSYGGLYSTSWAIVKGEKKHGCCWHHIVPAIDSGQIICKKNFKINIDDTAHSLDLKALLYGYKMFDNFIVRNYSKYKKFEFHKRLKLKSYFGKKDFLKFPNLGFLDFSKSLKKNILIFKSCKVSSAKKNLIFVPKILTNKGVLLVDNLKEVNKKKDYKKNVNAYNKNDKIKILNYSFFLKIKGKVFKITSSNFRNDTIYINSKIKYNSIKIYNNKLCLNNKNLKNLNL